MRLPKMRLLTSLLLTLFGVALSLVLFFLFMTGFLRALLIEAIRIFVSYSILAQNKFFSKTFGGVPGDGLSDIKISRS